MKILKITFVLVILITALFLLFQIPDAPYRTNLATMCVHDDVNDIDIACEKNAIQGLKSTRNEICEACDEIAIHSARGETEIAHKSYRKNEKELCTRIVRQDIKDNGAITCAEKSIQASLENREKEFVKYSLGFIEINDQGEFHDRAQLEAVFKELENLPDDTMVFVYTHGWKHNAAPNNKNVKFFRNLLSNVSDAEVEIANKRNKSYRENFKRRIDQEYKNNFLRIGKPGDDAWLKSHIAPEVYEKVIKMREMVASGKAEFSSTNIITPPRKVFGIYIGWRGLSHSSILANTTFWARKNTAQTVGEGAVTEVLLRLEKLINARRVKIEQGLWVDGKSRGRPLLVVVGHSFGSAVNYSALSQTLLNRHKEDCAHLKKDEVCFTRGYGDLVLLINPAFEALRYDALHEITSRNDLQYDDEHLPNLVIINSQGDKATEIAFPLGRKVSSLFEQESKSYDKYITSVGHYKPFQTHKLSEYEVVKQEKYKDGGCKVDVRSWVLDHIRYKPWWLRKGKSFDFESLGIKLERNTNEERFLRNPYLSVSVDKKIIPGHNDIYDCRLLHLLEHFIMQSSTGKKNYYHNK